MTNLWVFVGVQLEQTGKHRAVFLKVLFQGKQLHQGWHYLWERIEYRIQGFTNGKTAKGEVN